MSNLVGSIIDRFKGLTPGAQLLWGTAVVGAAIFVSFGLAALVLYAL